MPIYTTPIFKRDLGAHSAMLAGKAASWMVINGAMFVWAATLTRARQDDYRQGFLGASVIQRREG